MKQLPPIGNFALRSIGGGSRDRGERVACGVRKPFPIRPPGDGDAMDGPTKRDGLSVPIPLSACYIRSPALHVIGIMHLVSHTSFIQSFLHYCLLIARTERRTCVNTKLQLL